MVNLIGKPLWSDVRLLESHEYAQGGENGNMNEQAKALVNRTEFLKGLLEQLQNIQQDQQDWQKQCTTQMVEFGQVFDELRQQVDALIEWVGLDSPGVTDLASSIQTSFPLNTEIVPAGRYGLTLQIKQADQIRTQWVEYTHQNFAGSSDFYYNTLIQRLLEKAGLGYSYATETQVECYAPFALNQGSSFDVNGGNFAGFDNQQNVLTQIQPFDIKIIATDPQQLGEDITDLSSLFQFNGVMPDWVHSAGYTSSMSYDPRWLYYDYPMLLRSSPNTTTVVLGLHKGVQKIDWGDGNSSFSDETSQHTYAQAGEYLISVEQVSREDGSHGTIPTMLLVGVQGIQEVVQWYSGGYEQLDLQDSQIKVPTVAPLVFTQSDGPQMVVASGASS